MLDQTAVIVVVERLQGLLHGGLGQEDGFPPWAIRAPVPRAHYHGMDGVGLEVAPVVLTPVFRRAILIISRF